MEFQIHSLPIMQQAFAKLFLLNVHHTLAESTFPFHLCPDNDLMANCKKNSNKSNQAGNNKHFLHLNQII